MNAILRHAHCGYPLSLEILERHPDGEPARGQWRCPVCGVVGVGIWLAEGKLDLGLEPQPRALHP